jgi:signal transduction histidine kinase
LYSLKRELHRNLLITVTVVMLALCAALYQGIRGLTQDYVASRLLHDMDSVIAALTIDQGGQWNLPRERMSTVYNRVQSGHYYLVEVDGQRLYSRSLFDMEIEIPRVNQGENRCFDMQAPNRKQWMVCLHKVIKKGTALTIWVAEDISPLEHALRGFMYFALGAVALSIVALLAMQYRVLNRGFSQFEQIREAIRQMHLGTREFSLDQLPVEILPLIKEIDRLLAQLSTRVQRSRNAVGNLAHELKRPLQRLRTQLESADAKQRAEGDSIVQNIHNVVERELKRARIVGVATPGRHAVIDEDLPHLVQVMQGIYPGKTIQSVCAQNLTIPYDRDDVLELLGNLLDNACKFSKEKVSVQIERADAGWRISVEDDGEGVEGSDLNTIADRGVRLDENTQGHGLGLAICKDIVENYAGQIRFETAKLGGLAVVVFLPGSPDKQ